MKHVVTAIAVAASLSTVALAAGCGGTATVSVPGSIEAPTTPPAHQHVGFMVVEKSGVTQDENGVGGYGLVINNPTTRDAIWVSLQIHLLDVHSHIVATQTQFMELMPADNTYYVGGSFTSENDPVTRVSVSGTIRKSEPYRYALPNVSMLRIVTRPPDLETAVGAVANGLGYTLSRQDPVGIVYFGSHGRVIGGTSGILGKAVPDTNMYTFKIPIQLEVPIKSIAATVSDVAAPHHKRHKSASSTQAGSV
jgi:hypothetical protein